jgi:hypothetical protein
MSLVYHYLRNFWDSTKCPLQLSHQWWQCAEIKSGVHQTYCVSSLSKPPPQHSGHQVHGVTLNLAHSLAGPAKLSTHLYDLRYCLKL